MQCFVCDVQFVKLLTADCDCDGDDPAIVNGVVNGGIQIVVDGVPVVHNG